MELRGQPRKVLKILGGIPCEPISRPLLRYSLLESLHYYGVTILRDSIDRHVIFQNDRPVQSRYRQRKPAQAETFRLAGKIRRFPNLGEKSLDEGYAAPLWLPDCYEHLTRPDDRFHRIPPNRVLRIYRIFPKSDQPIYVHPRFDEILTINALRRVGEPPDDLNKDRRSQGLAWKQVRNVSGATLEPNRLVCWKQGSTTEVDRYADSSKPGGDSIIAGATPSYPIVDGEEFSLTVRGHVIVIYPPPPTPLYANLNDDAKRHNALS